MYVNLISFKTFSSFCLFQVPLDSPIVEMPRDLFWRVLFPFREKVGVGLVVLAHEFVEVLAVLRPKLLRVILHVFHPESAEFGYWFLFGVTETGLSRRFDELEAVDRQRVLRLSLKRSEARRRSFLEFAQQAEVVLHLRLEES
jgi:hypothetical protein